MSSLLTNASAMTALQTLQSTNKNLATTQNRIATGERVSQAADNAAYWSISTGMKTQNSSLSAVQDTLGLGLAVVDTAYTAVSEAIDLGKQIQAKFVAMEQFDSTTDEGALIQAEIDAMVEQINEIAVSANFQGMNLLAGEVAADGTVGTPGNIDIVIGFNEGAASKLTLTAVDVATEAANITDLATIGTFLTTMTEAAGTLGASKIRIESQQRFTGNLIDAIDRGIGQLIDADMNAESARLSALQTQQQLGIQALSIANQNSQNILSLFR